MELGKRLGANLTLDGLARGYDAVFLGIGLSGVNALGVAGDAAENVRDAIDFIAELRQAADLAVLPVGRRVLVIGGGMTAVDAAVQAKLLGAEDVAMVYRRGRDTMSASGFEQQLATSKGVRIITNARPLRMVTDGAVQAVEFAYTEDVPGGFRDTGETFRLPADQVFKAIGQRLDGAPGGVALEGGRIRVTSSGRTSRAGVWAGGDCVAHGDDLLVTAVAQGRDAPRTCTPRLWVDGKGAGNMATLATDFLGIRSPNPFWLASGPPTDKEYNVRRGFDAGWGGVVWKTLGEAGPPNVNVNGPRYGGVWGADRQLLGLNNIELITDRPLELNLREIKAIKRDYPDRAVVVSLMVPCEEPAWRRILRQVEDTRADGVELNFGCPHGMSERGMGSAVGQVPEYVEMVTRWVKASTRMPVIVKLTPNITDVRLAARAAQAGGADAVSLINTVNSITSVNLDTFSPEPAVDGKGSHGGYAGPRSSRSGSHGGRDRSATPKPRNCRSPESAASPPGATRPSTSRSVAARCRCARPPWCTASASSRK